MNAINKRWIRLQGVDEQDLFKEDIEKESLESIENANKNTKEKIAAINRLKQNLNTFYGNTNYPAVHILLNRSNANEKQKATGH